MQLIAKVKLQISSANVAGIFKKSVYKSCRNYAVKIFVTCNCQLRKKAITHIDQT